MDRLRELAVWMHERTGMYWVIGDEGTTAIGPFEAHEILRHFRVAGQPSEPVLGIPNYHEHYRPVPLPFPATEALQMRPEDLPPSVTRHDFPKTSPDIDWFSPEAKARAVLVALANTGDPWIDIHEAVFGRVARGTILWGHPPDAIFICRRPLPGERVAVIEWPPR